MGVSKSSSKKKKRSEPEDVGAMENDAVEEPTEEEKSAQEAAKEKRKAKKQKKNQEVEEDDPPDNDPEETGPQNEGEDDPEKRKKRLKVMREHKKVSGYRAKARECGFDKAGLVSASGVDSYASCLSLADAKRLMRFVPEVLNKCSYDKDECAERMELSYESVPASAARETQARCEGMLRHISNEAVLLAVSTGKMRIEADTIHSIIRKYAPGMTFSAILPPKGLLRHAQESGVLSSLTQDVEAKQGDDSENKTLVAAAKKLEKKEVDRKARKKEEKNKRDKEKEKEKSKEKSGLDTTAAVP